MKKIVLTFGLISGFISAALMGIMLPMVLSGKIDFERSEIAGYASIVLSCLLIFFGIRSYRENVGGGAVTFGKAFIVGLLITVISCVVYVAAWEFIYIRFTPDFYEKYTAHTLARMLEKGESAAAIAATRKKMTDFKVMYDNPFLNAAFTFMEPFPIGLAVTLISAAILRKKPSPA